MLRRRDTRFFSSAVIDAGSPCVGAVPVRMYGLFNALAGSPQLKLREKRLLTACLLMREIYQTEMKTMSLDKARVMREQQQYGEHMREQMLSGRSLRSMWFLFRHGDEAATDLDFLLQERLSLIRQQADEAQRERRAEVNAVASAKEEKWREQLEHASPYAKRLFNEISVTGRSLPHFPEREVAPARYLPGLCQLVV